MAEPVRIQKALADAGVASRRAAEALVEAGRVTVNGQPARTGQRVDPSIDALAVDGRPVVPAGRRIYLVMHKPAGVTSTVSDRHAERTVIDLLPAEMRGGARLYPVGRLDKDSEGLLLLTDDGEWTQRLLHPCYAVEREYAVGLRGPLQDWQLQALDEGIELDEGLARLVSLRLATRAEAERLERDPSNQAGRLRWYRAVLTQGWRRQLRRMFAALEAPVERLVRVRIGTLRLDDLPPGGVRVLSAAERDRLSASARRP
jgi:23S rRNA pseudouridine2605 synthase